MSILDPSKDHHFHHQPAPHEKHGQPQKGLSKNTAPAPGAHRPSARSQQPPTDTMEAARPTHERASSVPPNSSSGINAGRPALLPRAASEPKEVLRGGPKRGLDEATRSLQTFEALRSGSVHDPHVAQLCQKLLPLTDHAEGYKAFTLTGESGQVMGATQMPDDLAIQSQVAHPTLARRISMMVRQQPESTPSYGVWQSVAKLLIGNSRLPTGFSRAGTRLLRKGESFLLEASTAYGLPDVVDPAFADLARMHAVLLHHVGATDISPSDHSPACAAMCEHINKLLVGFARTTKEP